MVKGGYEKGIGAYDLFEVVRIKTEMIPFLGSAMYFASTRRQGIAGKATNTLNQRCRRLVKTPLIAQLGRSERKTRRNRGSREKEVGSGTTA